MPSLPPFVPGLELSARLFAEGVRPLMEARFPTLAYAAARLGSGSEVMGFDTPVSRDHHWGPRVTLFLSEHDLERHGKDVDAALGAHLPFEVDGYPTHFEDVDSGGGRLAPTTLRPIRHGVELTTRSRFLRDHLGRDVAGPPSVLDWLSFPSQRLLTIASGRVFHDPDGHVERVRAWLAWYPRDVWLYRMANEWRHVAQEEAFVGRAGDVGDDLGSRILATRLVSRLMRLAFLIERRYAPYGKWLGSAFMRLRCGPELGPVLARVLDAGEWTERERALGLAYRRLGAMHDALGVTEAIDATPRPHFERPYLVPDADRFVDALHRAIRSAEVRDLPPHVGGLDQFVDSSDVLTEPALGARLGRVYERGGE